MNEENFKRREKKGRKGGWVGVLPDWILIKIKERSLLFFFYFLVAAQSKQASKHQMKIGEYLRKIYTKAIFKYTI